MIMMENVDQKQVEDLVEGLENAFQQKDEMLETSIKSNKSYFFQTKVLCACMTIGTKDCEFGQT